MILSGALAELRDLLDDADKKKFPDSVCVRTLSRVQRGLFRQIAENRKDFSNFTMGISGTSATQVFENGWEFRLPTWVMHVLEVHYRDGDPLTAPTFSPYTWTGATSVRIGSLIPKNVSNDFQARWGWEGNHTIRLYGFTTVPNLLLRVVARPAALVQFTVDTKNTSASKLTLPATPDLGDLEKEEGSFINGEFQVTSTNSETSTNIGLMGRVVYSTANTTVGGDKRTECTMEAAWASALSVGDVVESMLVIPDEHCRYVILSTAMALFQRKPNVQAMKLVGGELMLETKRFLDFATAPRDAKGPTFVRRRGFNPYTRSDPNRAVWPY